MHERVCVVYSGAADGGFPAAMVEGVETLKFEREMGTSAIISICDPALSKNFHS